MPELDHKTIFAISGSLRSGSSNHHILSFLQRSAPADIHFNIYDDLAQIPPFDPGNDHEHPPQAVIKFRRSVRDADAIIICSPEYAYGVPGQLKNASDWTVSSGFFAGKPTALITAATGGQSAHAAMLLILGALSANLITGATLLVPFIRSKINAEGNVIDEATAENLIVVLRLITSSISNSPQE